MAGDLGEAQWVRVLDEQAEKATPFRPVMDLADVLVA